MSNIEKQGSQLTDLLAGNSTDEFNLKFAEFGGDYINTKVREDSIAEKILDVRKVDENSKQVQRDLASDTFYYYEEIEQDAIAMETAMRADAKPRTVDSKLYTIRIGKIETESVKKPKMELRVAKNIVKFVKDNNVDAITRTQDTVFMRTVRAAHKLTKSALGMPADMDYSDYGEAINWTLGARKEDLVSLQNVIIRKELKPARWLMSAAAYNVFSAMPASEIGDLAGDMLTNGFAGNLIKLPVVETIKSGLTDNLLTPATGGNFFDYEADDGKVYTDIYLFTEPNFLGKLIKVDDDSLWSKWEKDVFEWASWRYCGLGFGDIRGMAMMRIRLA